ncbi:Uncharacterised protein [Bifidobacterium adolescentis]|uniref:Uncharacterized protein n=1 Tax=Bifidobacterium adolescentis TaxID=1680 RepID=A0A174BYA9_BIFAD|nr:Uncharacterised protein [Bifidobacterium adolescentis]
MPASTSQRRTKPKVRRNSDVIKDTGFSPNAELANRMLVKAAEGFFGRIKVEAFYPEH